VRAARGVALAILRELVGGWLDVVTDAPARREEAGPEASLESPPVISPMLSDAGVSVTESLKARADSTSIGPSVTVDISVGDCPSPAKVEICACMCWSRSLPSGERRPMHRCVNGCGCTTTTCSTGRTSATATIIYMPWCSCCCIREQMVVSVSGKNRAQMPCSSCTDPSSVT